LSSADRTIKILDVETGEKLCNIITEHFVDTVAFSPDGKRIASGSRDNTLKLWDAEIGREILTYLALGSVNCCTFHPRGDMVCCGDEGGNVYLLRLFGLDG